MKYLPRASAEGKLRSMTEAARHPAGRARGLSQSPVVDTIPALLLRAPPNATRTASGCARTTGTATFAGALGQVGVLAARLRDEGVTPRGPGRRDDADDAAVPAAAGSPWRRSVRSRSPPTRPCTAGELAGLVTQVRPRLLVTDRRPGRTRRRGRGRRAQPSSAWSTSRTSSPTGRAAPDPERASRTDRSAAATTWRSSSRRRAPPGGRSWSCRPTGRTPWPGRASRTGWSSRRDDRLMTTLPALPHQRPCLLRARLPRVRCRTGPRAALLCRRLPRLRATAPGDRVQRDRRDARDPHASARAAATTRTPTCGSATRARRRRRSGRRRSRHGSGCGWCAATRCRSRRTA